MIENRQFEKERLEKIAKICDEIYYSTSIPEYAAIKITELNSLAGAFDYMELDRKMMVQYHQRACDLKQKSKKDEAWKRSLDYVQKLRGHTSMMLSRDFKS
jgi:hypothetical protein